MLDIIAIRDGEDLVLQNATAPKAANVVSTQLGYLEYAPNFGVDLNFFLQEGLEFQNESFKSYLVQRLTHHQINVSEVYELVHNLFIEQTFAVGDANESKEGFFR